MHLSSPIYSSIVSHGMYSRRNEIGQAAKRKKERRCDRGAIAVTPKTRQIKRLENNEEDRKTTYIYKILSALLYELYVHSYYYYRYYYMCIINTKPKSS